MKRQSLFAAKRCETAEHKTCKCRCGGLLHGVKRGIDPQFFESLEKDDPHFALEPQRKKGTNGTTAGVQA